MQDELLNCPFCNGVAEIEKDHADEFGEIFCIRCSKCRAQSDYYSYKENAISAWNQRA